MCFDRYYRVVSKYKLLNKSKDSSRGSGYILTQSRVNRFFEQHQQTRFVVRGHQLVEDPRGCDYYPAISGGIITLWSKLGTGVPCAVLVFEDGRIFLGGLAGFFILMND